MGFMTRWLLLKWSLVLAPPHPNVLSLPFVCGKMFANEYV